MAQPIYLDPELQGIERERQLAQALQQRGMKPVEGQMVGNRYVAPSWTQNLANLYDIYSGGQRMAAAENKAQSYADALRQQTAKDIESYSNIAQGTPATPPTFNYGNNEADQIATMTSAGTPAVAPNPQKALGVLMNSKSPQSQALAQALIQDQLKTLILPEGATAIRGSLGGYGGQTIQGAPKDPTEYKEFLKAQQGGYQGSFFDYQKDLKRAGAPSVSVNTEQTYGGTLAKGAAEQDLALKSIADNASQTVSNVARQKQILNSGKVFTGKGANIQQELAQYADALGLGGKDTATKIANTQSAISGLAGVTLDNIKASGLGSGQGFTDKDREFLQDARSGRITWNKESIMRVYDLQERAAIEGAKKWNQRYRQLPKSATQPLGWGEIEVPKPYGQSDIRSQADAIIGG